MNAFAASRPCHAYLLYINQSVSGQKSRERRAPRADNSADAIATIGMSAAPYGHSPPTLSHITAFFAFLTGGGAAARPRKRATSPRERNFLPLGANQ